MQHALATAKLKISTSKQLEAENAALRTENAALKQRIAELERIVKGEQIGSSRNAYEILGDPM